MSREHVVRASQRALSIGTDYGGPKKI